MKNYFFILVVFIVGIVLGAGGCMLIHKYFLQSETKEVVSAVETKAADEEFEAIFDFNQNLYQVVPTTQKASVQELKSAEQTKDKPQEQEKSHAFFAMFTALSVISLILAIAFSINASHSDQTRDMSIFFGIFAGICVIASFICY